MRPPAHAPYAGGGTADITNPLEMYDTGFWNPNVNVVRNHPRHRQPAISNSRIADTLFDATERALAIDVRLAADREAPLLGESVHRVLDRGFHFEVDRVDVFAIVDALWILVEVNRVQ